MPKLKQTEIDFLDNVFDTGQGKGYVLDFSDRTFRAYFDDEFKIDIYDSRYTTIGTSKGKRLRAFLTIEDGHQSARVLRALWEHRSSILEGRGTPDDPKLTDKYMQIVHRIEGESSAASTDAIERFDANETLEELIAAIQRDIGANKPQAALDRLHTYCMKKFAHLLDARKVPCTQDEPLNSRAGKYIKLLESQGQIHPMSLRIMKSSISILDSFNDVRNNKSFAHDNEIMSMHEARFIFDSVSSILRFIRSFEANKYGS